MSRTSVFNYFGHKEMILCEIGARYVSEIAGPLQGRDAADPREAFSAVTDALAELASRQPALISAVARETTHPDPERRKCARDTMGYSRLIDEMLDGLVEQGMLRHPDYKESYGNQIVDLLSGVLIRLAGTASRDELRREIGRSLELFMAGAMREPLARRRHRSSSSERERQPLLSRRLRARDAGSGPGGRLGVRRRAAGSDRLLPGGGGQPADHGWLRGRDGRSWTVTAARKQGDDIWHARGG